MGKWLSDNPVTAVMLVLVLIAAVVGAAVVIWGDPGTLSFEAYLDLLWKFAAAVGVLAVGKGLAKFGQVSDNK